MNILSILILIGLLVLLFFQVKNLIKSIKDNKKSKLDKKDSNTPKEK